jgi:hypothetical protein
MNYIRVSSLTTIFISFITLCFAQNNKLKDSSISTISYAAMGSESGFSESIEVSSDSIIYYLSIFEQRKRIAKKTSKKLWQRLTKSLDLNEFDKIKSNPRNFEMDGTDIEIAIETAEKKHSMVNGDRNEIEKNIGKFIKLLRQQLQRLREMTKEIGE